MWAHTLWLHAQCGWTVHVWVRSLYSSPGVAADCRQTGVQEQEFEILGYDAKR